MGLVRIISMAWPLKNSVSKGVGSREFGIKGTKAVEFCESNSTFSVRIGGSGIGDIPGGNSLRPVVGGVETTVLICRQQK